MSFYDKIFPPKKITLSNGKEVLEKRSRMPLVILLLLVASWVAIDVTGFDINVLIKRGEQFFVILKRMIPPDFGYMKAVWGPLFDTIKMSLLGSVVGAVAAIPFAIIAASNIVKSRSILTVTRLFLSLVRTMPTLVVALIATYIFGLGTLAGTTAIAVFTFAYVGKLLYEQIETVDMGAFEAMEAAGATKLRSFMAAIVPQVLPSYIANCLFCFEGNVRYASILGYVGAGGLGLIMNEKIGWKEYPSVGMILLALFVTVMIIEAISHYLRKKLT
ncbi:MAG: phosphonate ABC transporter, permease protein PhnE [Cellulosilyticaceae bacterium]